MSIWARDYDKDLNQDGSAAHKLPWLLLCSSISTWVPPRSQMALILDPPLKMMRRGKTRTRRHLCALAWWSPPPTRRRQCELWANAALWCSGQSWSSSQQTEQAGAGSGLTSSRGNTLQKAGKKDADPDRLLVNIVTDVVIVVDGSKRSDFASTYSSLVLVVLTSWPWAFLISSMMRL